MTTTAAKFGGWGYIGVTVFLALCALTPVLRDDGRDITLALVAFAMLLQGILQGMVNWPMREEIIRQADRIRALEEKAGIQSHYEPAKALLS